MPTRKDKLSKVLWIAFVLQVPLFYFINFASEHHLSSYNTILFNLLRSVLMSASVVAGFWIAFKLGDKRKDKNTEDPTDSKNAKDKRTKNKASVFFFIGTTLLTYVIGFFPEEGETIVASHIIFDLMLCLIVAAVATLILRLVWTARSN